MVKVTQSLKINKKNLNKRNRRLSKKSSRSGNVQQQQDADGTSHAGPKAIREIEGVHTVISRGTPKQRVATLVL